MEFDEIYLDRTGVGLGIKTHKQINKCCKGFVVFSRRQRDDSDTQGLVFTPWQYSDIDYSKWQIGNDEKIKLPKSKHVKKIDEINSAPQVPC